MITGKRNPIALALVICLVFSLAGCGFGSAESKKTFEMTVCIASEPTTLDPTLNKTVDGAIMIQHMFEGLMKYKDDGTGKGVLTEGQAESYTISDDGLVYTFKLRKDAFWADGQHVTASDFVYSWQRLVDPKSAASYNYMLDVVVNASKIAAGEVDPSELGITALDDTTVEITLNAPAPYFLEICSLPATVPLRRDLVEKGGDHWTFYTATYIGNGPYKLSEWAHESYFKMIKSKKYYDFARLGPDYIKFILMNDSKAKLAAYKRGEILHLWNPPISETPVLLKSNEIKIADYIGTYYLTFNNQKKPFDDSRIREAFSLAIDRNYIVEHISGANEVPASAIVPNGVYDLAGPSSNDFRTVGGAYFSVDPADYKANCAKARQLMTDAGYPGGKGFPTAKYLYNTSDTHKAIAKALKNMWQTELGVKITLTDQAWDIFTKTRRSGNYMIARDGWIADYNDPITFLDMFISSSGNNDPQYKSSTYDAIILGVKTAKTPEERFKRMHDAEDLLFKDKVTAPIFFYTRPYMQSEKVKGMFCTPLSNFYFSYCTYDE